MPECHIVLTLHTPLSHFRYAQAVAHAGDNGFLADGPARLAFAYDSIGVVAEAFAACLRGNHSRDTCASNGAMMPYIRSTTFSGVGGTIAFEPGSNHPAGRLVDILVGHTTQSDAPYFKWQYVTTTSTTYANLEVCDAPSIGDQCDLAAAPPGKVKCFASRTSIVVEWEPASSENAGLLSGYRVTAAYGKDSVVSRVGARTTSFTFAASAASGSMQLHTNLVYNLQVAALYDNSTILSASVTCQIPQAGLPCIPPTSSLGRYDGGNMFPVCGCKSVRLQHPLDPQPFAHCT